MKMQMDKEAKGTHLEFEMKLGKKPIKKEVLFVPLSEDRYQALLKLRQAKRRRLGNANNGSAGLYIMPRIKKIEWVSFYPTGTIDSWLDENYHGVAFPSVRRMGIGSLVHHAVTEKIAELFPHYKIQHLTVSYERRDHLNAMGIDERKSYPIENYRDIVRRYMKKKFGMNFE